jgi:hypothetical protein
VKARRMMIEIVLGDLRERTRRYSFLITLLGALFAGYLVVTGKWTVRLGEYRGVYNSAWVGSLMGSASTIMLALFGFYLVKNSIDRDRETGVGEILATTPLSKLAYVASKFISNFAVLALMAAVLAAAAVVMQLASRVEGGFDLWALVAPFLFVCLPVMALVAAMAVLFESIWWLRGTIGNILYVFIAQFAFVNHLFLDAPFLDFSGFGLFAPSMEQAALAAYPGAQLGFEVGFVGMFEGGAGGAPKLFLWEGMDWSLAMVPLRLLWILCAVGIIGVAARCFDGFDPARERRREPGERARTPRVVEDDLVVPAPVVRSFAGMSKVKMRFGFLRMLAAELRLMLKGHHWSWYVVAGGLVAAQLAVPYEYARRFALPAAWIWPLAIWSGMGTREARFHTGEFLFSSPYPLSRQFPAIWVAGLLISACTALPMLIRALAAGESGQLAVLLAGAVFVPTLALALGTMSGSRKLFEVGYLLLWYVGPVNGLPALDFLGTTDAAAETSIPLVCVVSSLALLCVALLWRRRQRT